MEKVPIWLEAARLWDGVEATPGSVATPAILGLYAACGHDEIRSDEVPWCAGFVGGILAECGLPNTRSLAAASYLEFGAPLDGPRVGAIAVLDNHVAFVDSVSSRHVVLIGGNQGHSEGRSAVTRASFRIASVRAWRWPVPLVRPRDLDGASRTVAKGKADVLAGWTTTTVAAAAIAQGGPPAIETAAAVAPALDVGKSLGLLDLGMKSADSLVKLAAGNPAAVILLLIGIYLVASGSLLRLWRTEDANTGRNVSSPTNTKERAR